MTQFQTWPKFYGEKYSDSFMKIESKLCPLECTQAKVDRRDGQMARPMDIAVSQKLTLSTLCSGELKM